MGEFGYGIGARRGRRLAEVRGCEAMVDGPVGLAPPSAGAGRHLLYGAGQSGRAVRLRWRHRPAGAWLAQLSERSGQGFWAARSCGLMGHGAVARRPPSAMSRDLMGHRPWRAVRAPWAMSVRVAVVSRRRSRGAAWRHALWSDARAGPAGQLVEHGRAGLCGLSRWGAARLSRTLPTGESGHPPDACRGRRELYYNALPLGSVPAGARVLGRRLAFPARGPGAGPCLSVQACRSKPAGSCLPVHACRFAPAGPRLPVHACRPLPAGPCLAVGCRARRPRAGDRPRR